MSSITPLKKYELKIDANVLTCSITLQEYSKAKLISSQSATNIVSGVGGESISFKAEGADYISAIVSMTYADSSKPTKTITSVCNICLILVANNPFVWQVTGTYAQGDNTTIFLPGTVSGNDPSEHQSGTIEVRIPTEVNNPNVAPSSAKVLRPSQVYVVDFDATKKTLLVRGNSPLGPEATGGGQLIDFQNLEEAIVTACKSAGISNTWSSNYELYDVSLLSAAEEYIWANEYNSFGGSGAAPKTDEQWIPTDLFKLPGLDASSSAKGTWSRWNVQPDKIGTVLSDLVKMLKKGMAKNTTENLKIYYIHCASGHDRTGMVSACYLASKALDKNPVSAKIDTEVDKAYVMGTTLLKQPTTGGDIVATCYDWTGGAVSATKSRCFPVLNSGYTTTLLKALSLLNANKSSYSLDAKAKAKTLVNETTPKSYVVEDYPFMEIL